MGKIIFRRVRKVAKSVYYLRHVCSSVFLSAWNNSATNGRMFTKFDVLDFFETLPRKFKFLGKSDMNDGVFA